jgi:uncharacterized protein YbaP (TraB family)
MLRRSVRSLVALLVLAWLAAGCAPKRAAAPAAQGAAPPSTALLWRVTHGGNTSYLFGTIHLDLDVERILGVEGHRLLATSRALYVEMDLSNTARTRELGATAARAGRLPPGESLQRMLSPAEWAQLQKTMPNTPPATLDRLEPWIAALSTLQAIAARSDASPAAPGASRKPPMDVVLVQDARARGIPVFELDSMQQQLTAFTSMPRPMAVDMLRELLGSPEGAGRELRDIVQAYGSPNAEQQLAAVVGAMARRTPTFADYLLFRRSRRWADVLERPLRSGGVFVAVGAGHLVGPQGLPALLRSRGFKVERVR